MQRSELKTLATNDLEKMLLADCVYPRGWVIEELRERREIAERHDPDSIDLERPETSGVGRAPRAGDMTIRTMCHTSLAHDEREATPHDEWSAASWTAWLLRRLPVEVVAEVAEGVARTATAIMDQETKAAEEAAAAADPGLSGTSDPEPSKAKAATAPSTTLARRRRAR